MGGGDVDTCVQSLHGTALIPEDFRSQDAGFVEAAAWIQRQARLFNKQNLTEKRLAMLQDILGTVSRHFILSNEPGADGILPSVSSHAREFASLDMYEILTSEALMGGALSCWLLKGQCSLCSNNCMLVRGAQMRPVLFSFKHHARRVVTELQEGTPDTFVMRIGIKAMFGHDNLTSTSLTFFWALQD